MPLADSQDRAGRRSLLLSVARREGGHGHWHCRRHFCERRRGESRTPGRQAHGVHVCGDRTDGEPACAFGSELFGVRYASAPLFVPPSVPYASTSLASSASRMPSTHASVPPVRCARREGKWRLATAHFALELGCARLQTQRWSRLSRYRLPPAALPGCSRRAQPSRRGRRQVRQIGRSCTLSGPSTLRGER